MISFMESTENFDVLLFDNYGVITFGQGISKSVLRQMERLKEMGKTIIILSNSSASSAASENKYAKKGLLKGVHYDKILTSGEYASEVVRRGKLPVQGKKMFVFGTANFGRPEDKLPDMFKSTEYSVVDNLDDADFIYCGVPQINGEDRIVLEDFIPKIAKCLKSGLPMVCANPDYRANEGGRFVVRAGLICKVYNQLGGNTVIFGKPCSGMYNVALRGLDVPKEKALMVGDTLRTDILGAQRAGIKSCLVIEGGMTEYTLKERGREVTMANVVGLAYQDEGIVPDYICERVSDEEPLF